MPQTFNVGARSRFVTFIAWLAIVLAASTVAWAALQMASQPSWAALAAGRRDLPWLVARLLRGLPWIHAGAIALSLATLAGAVGLLRRLEWARRAFIGLLALAIVAAVGGLWLQQELLGLMIDTTLRTAPLPQAAAEAVGGMALATRLLATAVTVAAGTGLAVVIRRLMSPAVRQEFA